MRPKQHETTGSADLFRARLEQIINMKHELVVFPANREFYREFSVLWRKHHKISNRRFLSLIQNTGPSKVAPCRGQ